MTQTALVQRAPNGRFITTRDALVFDDSSRVTTPNGEIGNGGIVQEFASYQDYLDHFNRTVAANDDVEVSQTADDLAASRGRSIAAYHRLFTPNDDVDPAFINDDVIEDFGASPIGLRSIGGILCKIWTWFRKALDVVLETIADALKFIGRAALSLISDLVDQVIDWFGDGPLGGIVKVALLGGAAYLLYLLLAKNREDANRDADRENALEAARISNGLE